MPISYIEHTGCNALWISHGLMLIWVTTSLLLPISYGSGKGSGPGKGIPKLTENAYFRNNKIHLE